ncbi:MAG: response regulator, partial [Oscillospiraceae bacterium]
GKIFCDVQSIPTSDNRLLVKLLVNDTGSGISTEFLSKVFLPFEQEYVKDNENFQGTGLGLAIVKNIVELMGGRISAASKNGVGTSFSAFFYIEYSDGVENGEKSRKTGDTFQVLNGKCVLLAEDHMLNAKIMFNLLEKQKMKVFHAKNGAEAVAMFEQSESGFFDAVLMDIRMPQMDGLTAAFKIRALNRSDAATVPIIAMTANAFDEDIQRSLESGMNDHLSKPIEAKKLWSTLSRYIGR